MVEVARQGIASWRDSGQGGRDGEQPREALLRGMIRSRRTVTALEAIDALELGELVDATQVIAAEAEHTLTHAGVPLSPDSEAVLPKVPVAAAGLEAADVEAATRTHSGEPLPEPDAEATAATVARTKAKDQAIAEAERARERSAKGEDERPRRRREIW